MTTESAACEVVAKLYEHNNWANTMIIQVCSSLSDSQLDAEPSSATKGNIRMTLWHLMASQQRYLSLLTGLEPHFNWQAPPSFEELRKAAAISGEVLLTLVKEEPNQDLKTHSLGEDYLVRPWVVMLQIINHATEHREQIKSMLTALGFKAPEIDGWTYGESIGALTLANQGA